MFKKTKRIAKEDIVFSIVNYAILTLFLLIILYPLYYMSVSYTHLDVYKRQVGSVLPALGVAARKHRTEALYKMEGRNALSYCLFKPTKGMMNYNSLFPFSVNIIT